MIRVLELRPCRKNTLRAFVDLELTATGLVIRDCAWHVHESGREWISFPAKPYEGDDGVQHWQPLVEFAPGASATRRKFQEQAIAAVHEWEEAREQA